MTPNKKQLITHDKEDIGKWRLEIYALPNEEGKMVIHKEWTQITNRETVDPNQPFRACIDCKLLKNHHCMGFEPPLLIEDQPIDEPRLCSGFEEKTP
jgi:hypothetical protein